MKKLTKSLLSIVICLCVISTLVLSVFAYNTVSSTLPNTDTPYTYIDNITVKVPGTEYTVTLNKVSTTAGMYYDENNKPVYRFALMESDSSIVWEHNTFGMYTFYFEEYGYDGIGDLVAEAGDISTNGMVDGYEIQSISIGELDTTTGEIVIYELGDSSALATIEIFFGEGNWTYYEHEYDAGEIISETEHTMPADLIYAPSTYWNDEEITTFDITTLDVNQPKTYDVIDGANSTWNSTSKDDLTVTVDVDCAKFVGVKVDGNVIDAKNYTVTEGSTIINLKQDYLSSLPNGNHELTIVFDDGEASTSFEIKATPNNLNNNANDDTKNDASDNSNNVNIPKTDANASNLYFVLSLSILVSVLCGVVIVIKSSKSKKYYNQ